MYSITALVGIQKIFLLCLNIAVRCFNISHLTAMRNVIYYLCILSINLLSQERKVLLLQFCLNYSGFVRWCGLLKIDEEVFKNICFKYVVH